MPAVPRFPAPRSSRPGRHSPTGVLQVDWPFFGELCRALALKVYRDYEPDLVLGIAKAGVIPGAVISSILQCDFASMAITRADTGSRPVVIAGPPALVTGRQVLIVDETCDSGDTMKLALHAVRELKPAFVKTAVSFRTGPFAPDYCALETESFIILPWDREVIVDGEIVCLDQDGRSSFRSLQQRFHLQNAREVAAPHLDLGLGGVAVEHAPSLGELAGVEQCQVVAVELLVRSNRQPSHSKSAFGSQP